MPQQVIPNNRPITDRIDFRVVTLVAIVSLLVGVPVYSFVKLQLSHGIDKSGNLYRVDLKAMGNFPFDDSVGSIENVPQPFRILDGKRVALEGFVAPQTSASGHVGSFQFVYNPQKCCFGGPPKVQERVFAFVPDQGTIPFTGEEIRLIGKLHVKVEKDPDPVANKVLTVYTMAVENAEPL